jgi:hypothetical protein
MYSPFIKDKQMATTSSRSITQTFTRTELLKLQIVNAVHNTTDTSIEELCRFCDTAIDSKLINEIIIRGLDKDNYCHVEMSLKIDWKEHEYHLSCEKTTIQIGSEWKDNTAYEIGTIIKLFNLFVEEKKLDRKWYFCYTEGVDVLSARAMLGSSTVSPVKWKAGTKGKTDELTIKQLSELSVLFRYIDN